MEGVRFLGVALVGLGIDLATSWSLANYLNWPLWLAASTGFTTAAAVNYTLHELWTFREGDRQLSTARALRYFIILLVTLTVRVGAVAGLTMLLGSRNALLILALGACVSFGVNFLLSKWLVFCSGWRHGHLTR